MLHIPAFCFFDTTVTCSQWVCRVKFVVITPHFILQQYLWNIAIQLTVGCYNSWANLQCSGCSPLGEKLLWNGTIQSYPFFHQALHLWLHAVYTILWGINSLTPQLIQYIYHHFSWQRLFFFLSIQPLSNQSLLIVNLTNFSEKQIEILTRNHITVFLDVVCHWWPYSLRRFRKLNNRYIKAPT